MRSLVLTPAVSDLPMTGLAVFLLQAAVLAGAALPPLTVKPKIRSSDSLSSLGGAGCFAEGQIFPEGIGAGGKNNQLSVNDAHSACA